MSRQSIYRGKNRYREFLSAANIIATKIGQIKEVVGILATGGIGRGFCDYYSDLDLIVYADDAHVRRIDQYIAVGYLRYKGIELDTPVESYQKALAARSPSRLWSQVVRWDRQNSRLLHDTDNRIADLLTEKLVFPDSEQRRLLARYRKEVDEQLSYNFQMRVKRGRRHHMAACLIRAIQHIILWIYAKNKQFQPYLPKWLFYHLDHQSVPEARYLDRLKNAYTNPATTVTQAKNVHADLMRLCHQIGLKHHLSDIEMLFKQHERNWGKANERTRHYLSW
ncbi:MAG: DUF4037 domain-containing protein [bacterium]